MSDEEKEWGYWNGQPTLKVYQAIWLMYGYLPPKDSIIEWKPESNVETVPSVDFSDAYLADMAEYLRPFDEHYIKFVSSLRSDPDEGARWREKDNGQIVEAYISRETFLKHWRKCGLPIHKKLQIEKQGKGRPKKVDIEALQHLAQECASRKKNYAEFIRAVTKEFGCSPSRAKELFPAKTYKQL
jgi:hypothetical protein